jgi:hypothetical protein
MYVILWLFAWLLIDLSSCSVNSTLNVWNISEVLADLQLLFTSEKELKEW